MRSLCYRGCEEYLDGTDVTMLASMAKLKAGRMMRLVTDGCLQYWGGAGYLWERPRARLPRSAPGLDWRRRRRGHAANHLQAHGHAAAAGKPLMGDADDGVRLQVDDLAAAGATARASM